MNQEQIRDHHIFPLLRNFPVGNRLEVHCIAKLSGLSLDVAKITLFVKKRLHLFYRSTPLENVNVYIFTSTGSYLGIHGKTNQDGIVTFRLPEGTYMCRGDYQRSQYWATGPVNAHQVNVIKAVPLPLQLRRRQEAPLSISRSMSLHQEVATLVYQLILMIRDRYPLICLMVTTSSGQIT